MRDKEIWLNGSGYPDPTAYKALKEIMKMEIKAGEIYNTKTDRDMGRQVLILATDGRVCTVLNVKEEGHELDDLHLFIGDKEVYMNSRMIQYCFTGKLEDKIHTFNKDQFDYVMDKVADSLCLKLDESDELECAKEVIQAKKDEINRMKKQFDNVVAERDAEIRQLSEELQDVILKSVPHEDAVKLEIERDLYKSLYENTLERLIAR